MNRFFKSKLPHSRCDDGLRHRCVCLRHKVSYVTVQFLPSVMGVGMGGKTGIRPRCKMGPRNKSIRKRETSSFILIRLVNSCNDSLFANMTLTVLKSRQVHCSGNMH